MIIQRILRIAPASALALAAATSPYHAQVQLSGDVHDGQGGPLLGGVVYHAQTKLDVPASETLTVHAGAVIKFKTGLDWNIDVDGTLDVNGTSELPVVFTSILDDTAGGDSALDGPTTPGRGDWGGLNVRAGGALDLEHAEIRFAGFGGWSSVWCNAGTVDLRHCTIRDGGNEGVTFNQQDTPFTRIEDCAFVGCEGYALDDVPLEVVPGIANNTAAGNGVDAMRCPGSVGTDVEVGAVIGPENCLEGALVIDGVVTVAEGAELRLLAGAIVKVDAASSTRWVVHGDLRLEGTAVDPVVITTTGDDSWAGDTLGDGPTTGNAGDWTGIRIHATGSLVADHAVLRYGGKTGESSSSMMLLAAGGPITLRDCELRDAQRSAFDADGSTAAIVVERCDFVDNEDYPIVDLHWEAVHGLDDNTASGNGAGDFPRMSNLPVTASAEVRARNQINGVLGWTNFLNISTGGTLTLHKGVVLKTLGDDRITVAGSLQALGTPHEPVVFTTIDDDEYAGDSNGDGPSLGTPGTWAGLQIEPDAGPTTLRNLRVRFGGASHPGVWVRSPLTDLRAVRVERCSRQGFELDDAASVVNCTAFQNGLAGFELDGGAFDVLHATSVGNGGDGFDHGVPYTGVVRNSVAWGNGGSNYDGFEPGELVHSCGDATLAGVDGNVGGDPLLANELGGDLRLTVASPCVDAGDFATGLALVFDAQEHSRILPGSPTSIARPDMGAFELAHWVLEVSGRAAPGESLTLRTFGEDGLAFFLFGLLDDTVYIDQLGFITAGVQTLQVLPVVTPVNTSWDALIGSSASFLGVEFGLQAAGLSSVTPDFLHFTNLYRGRFEPAL